MTRPTAGAARLPQDVYVWMALERGQWAPITAFVPSRQVHVALMANEARDVLFGELANLASMHRAVRGVPVRCFHFGCLQEVAG